MQEAGPFASRVCHALSMKRAAGGLDEDFPRGGGDFSEPGHGAATVSRGRGADRPAKRRAVALPRLDEDQVRACSRLSFHAARLLMSLALNVLPVLRQDGGAGITARVGTFVEQLKYKARTRRRVGATLRPPNDHRRLLSAGLLTASVLTHRRAQNLNVGTKLWGVVVDVSNSRLTVALPSGLRGTVRAAEVRRAPHFLRPPHKRALKLQRPRSLPRTRRPTCSQSARKLAGQSQRRGKTLMLMQRRTHRTRSWRFQHCSILVSACGA